MFYFNQLANANLSLGPNMESEKIFCGMVSCR